MAEEQQMTGSGRVETTQPTLVQKKEELVVTPEFLTCSKDRGRTPGSGQQHEFSFRYIGLGQLPYRKTASPVQTFCVDC